MLLDMLGQILILCLDILGQILVLCLLLRLQDGLVMLIRYAT